MIGRRHGGHRHRVARGAVAIEMIALVPLLVVLILSIVEFGRYFLQRHTAQNAAEDGARYAVTHPAATDDEIRSRTLAVAALGPGVTVTFARTNVDGVAFVEVSVRKPFRFLIPFVDRMQATITGRVRRPAI